jgi:excisionase family DNA binding protein
LFRIGVKGLRTNNFDPLAYIENAFLDTRPSGPGNEGELAELDLTLPSLADYMGNGASSLKVREAAPETESAPKKARFKKTVMSAPRPRRTKRRAKATPIDSELESVWTALPKNVSFLCSFFDDNVTKNYYRGEFKESRQELIRRLLDPELSLEETSRLLGVCPATVRRYTNRGWLKHHRTVGGQRRFRLGDIVRFVDEHGRLPEE